MQEIKCIFKFRQKQPINIFLGEIVNRFALVSGVICVCVCVRVITAPSVYAGRRVIPICLPVRSELVERAETE